MTRRNKHNKPLIDDFIIRGNSQNDESRQRMSGVRAFDRNGANSNFNSEPIQSPPVKQRLRPTFKPQAPKKQLIAKKKIFSPFKMLKRGFQFLLLLFIVTVGYFGVKGWSTLRSVVEGGATCPVSLCGGGVEIAGEGDGRINILVAGIGGENHEGGDLTDTIIVASIDPVNSELGLLSIPRDLYVDIPGFGSDRINAAHRYGITSEFSEEGYAAGGMGLLEKTIEQALEIPIHYYIRADFTAFLEIVDTLGGVDLDVPNAIYDENFAWQYGVLNLQAGQQNLDGVTALMYLRSRYTSPGGDFDRNDRQREIILALKDQALASGAYKDPRNVLSVLDTLNDNVRTNIQIGEADELYSVIAEIPNTKIVSAGFTTSDGGLLQNSNIGGADVLTPTAGDFSEIQDFTDSLFSDGYVKSENASVAILNATNSPILATQAQEALVRRGYNVVYSDDLYDDIASSTLLYSNGEKPFSTKFLEDEYGTESVSGSAPDTGYLGEADIVIILGEDSVQSIETSYFNNFN